MFGAIRSSSEDLGFPASSDSSGVDSSNREKVVMPFIDAFATFRDEVRKVAREAKVGGVLDLCDAVRDDVLPHLGVRLEDKEGERSRESGGRDELAFAFSFLSRRSESVRNRVLVRWSVGGLVLVLRRSTEIWEWWW